MGALRLWRWLSKTAPIESEATRIERLLNGLSHADYLIRQEARFVLSQTVYNIDRLDSTAFLLALLDALERRADLRDIEEILRYVDFLTMPYAHTNEAILRAAQRCSERLKERYQAEYLAQTLLHTVGATEIEQELLRPVQNVSEPNPERLLRPVQKEK